MGSVAAAEIQTERVTGGITNPFETSFKPLIENIKSSKVELEDLASVANHECMFNIAI